MNYETKMSNPETGRMFDQLADLIRETIEVPNKMLPARFRDKPGSQLRIVIGCIRVGRGCVGVP